MDWLSLVADSFVDCTCFILPPFVRAMKGQESQDDKDLAVKRMDHVRKTFGVEEFSKELQNHIEDILIQMMLRLFDPPNSNFKTSKFTRDLDPKPSEPCFTSQDILMVFEYLSASYYGESKPSVNLLLRKKDSMQRILMSLVEKIASSEQKINRLQCVRSYFFFVTFLFDNLESLQENGGRFVIREILHRVVAILKDIDVKNASDLVALDICYEIILSCSQSCFSLKYATVELGHCLYPLINVLQTYANVKNKRMDETLQLLRCLVVDGIRKGDSPEYIQSVAKLDNFPNMPQFSVLNKTISLVKVEVGCADLISTLKRFVQISRDYPHADRNGSLTNLLEVLRDKADDIASMVRSSKDTKTVLLDLMASLLHFCKHGDKNCSALAADCFGVLGPLDLNSLSLPSVLDTCSLSTSYVDVIKDFGDDYSLHQHYIVLKIMVQLLIDDNIDVCITSANCIKQALNTQSASDFLQTCDTAFTCYLTPFLPCKKKKQTKGKAKTSTPP